jgi:esterase FrsA
VSGCTQRKENAVTYRFPVDPDSIFEERTPQFVNLGIPAEDVARLRSLVNDMWLDAPGGWTYEWSRVAERYAADGDHYLASLAYGGAKFPCLADDAKTTALGNQVKQYLLASSGFPLDLERKIVRTLYRDQTVEVPVHILSPHGARPDTPVLIASGGIDTWKMDLHPLFVGLALGANLRVVSFEHAGVGELTNTPMTPDSREIVDGLIAFARTLTTGRVGHFGLSFGGYFAASTGLRGVADAAIVVGGPVSSASFGPEHASKLMYGMDDIFGNAVGFHAKPDPDTLIEVSCTFALDELLRTDHNCPMLVINGDADIHVPVEDTRIFEGRRRSRVVIIPGGSHCALNKTDQVVPILIDWATRALHP